MILQVHLVHPHPTCSVCHAVKEDPAVLKASEAHIVALFNADHRHEIQDDGLAGSPFNGFRAVAPPIRVLMSWFYTQVTKVMDDTSLKTWVIFATFTAAISWVLSTHSTCGT